jgi:phosphatidylserine/phosphatidylglycerophosphate/cardiolipin synthase-like enzyme
MGRRSRRQQTSLLSVIVTVVVLAILWAANAFLQGSATPTPAVVTEAGPISSSWYQLYFSDPARTADLDNPTGGIPDAIAATLVQAQQTIDAAVYEIDLPIYGAALIAAHQRGVRVRIVTDTDYLDETVAQAIKKAGIPIVDDQRDAFMHNKFVVIDGASVWTGSANFTFNDAYRNNNSALLIRSTRLAENYSAQFERLFTERDFSPGLIAPNQKINLAGTLVENYFSPDGGVAAAILDVLRSAQSSIHFMAFSFTRSDFAGVMIEKANAGLAVQGVFETRQVAAGGDGAWNALTGAGVDVRQDGNKYNLHSKVIIVDQQIVVMGSYNFSRNAEEQNNENILILHNPEIAAAYFAEWQKVWAEAGK